MGKKFLSLGTVFAVLGFLPAAAQANHINHAASSIACVLVGDQPTLQTRTAYRQFSESEKPVRYDVHVDGQTPISGAVLEWSGPDYDQLVSLPAVSGPHSIIYYASWAGWQFHDQLSATVYCPSPPPPTAPPAPLTAPAPTPPPTVAPPPIPPAPPIKPCVAPRVRLKVYPRRRLHGEVDFVASGVEARRVSSVRWYVRHPGLGWRRVGTSGRPWEYLAHRDLSWHVYLWVEQVWGYPQWGARRVKVVVKTRGGGGTCAGRAEARMTYFNHDPEPRARHWG